MPDKTRWSDRLRHELSTRAARWADETGVPYYQSLGTPPVTLFPVSDDGSRHGNFTVEAWSVMRGEAAWARRLGKPHTKRNALPQERRATARELDSCTSSDALLMNLFCYPGAVRNGLATLLGAPPDAMPTFGVRGEVPLLNGSTDRTEIDMVLGETYVEAKLTETDFTTCGATELATYADLDSVFDVTALPREGEGYVGYQLIRNVLAIARRPSARLIVMLDARRPDLLRAWWRVHGAIRDTALRQRCGFATWQEGATLAPAPLREFLHAKYGL